MKKRKVGIATIEDMKKRTMAIARGDIKPSRDDPKIWFTWPESFAKVLSNRNRALLTLIAATHPDSLQALAARTGRKALQSLPHPADDGALRICPPAQGRTRPPRSPAQSWPRVASVLPLGNGPS
jgi:hypothetical protein